MIMLLYLELKSITSNKTSQESLKRTQKLTNQSYTDNDYFNLDVPKILEIFTYLMYWRKSIIVISNFSQDETSAILV